MLPYSGIPRVMFDDREEAMLHPLQMYHPRFFPDMSRFFDGHQIATPTTKNGKFQLVLDLHQFKPEEVQVKFDDKNMLQVRGRREVKSEDGSSYEFREYVHHFSVPDTVQYDKLASKLDKNGFLKVEAPLKAAAVEDGHRHIPIEYVQKH